MSFVRGPSTGPAPRSTPRRSGPLTQARTEARRELRREACRRGSLRWNLGPFVATVDAQPVHVFPWLLTEIASNSSLPVEPRR